MRIGLLICALVLGTPAFAADGIAIELADWAQPRDALAVSRHPALRAAVAPLLENPGLGLEVRFPDGDEASLLAGELHAWLVALGIETERILLKRGRSAPDRIELHVKRL